jgi:hypothetical protein
VRWKDYDIVTAINEGLDELSEETRFYERHVSIPVVNRRTYYDLRGWLPESALGVTSVWSEVLTDWLVPTTVRELKSRWEQAAGSPRSFFMRGLYWMGVFPRPETTIGTHRVYFAGYAPHFNFPQAVLRDLTDDRVAALEEYAMYELAAQDGETDRALAHFVDYRARAKDLANFVNRRTVTARSLKMGSK